MEIKTFYIFWRKDVVGVLDYMYTKIILESKGRFIFWYQLKMVFIIIVFYSLIMYWYTKYVLYFDVDNLKCLPCSYECFVQNMHIWFSPVC